MKLLLDECTPARLKWDFQDYDVQTVDDAGLKGLKNGELLRTAISNGFDALITVDQNISFQQNLTELPISILILLARSNRYEDLRLLSPKVLEALRTIRAGDVIRVREGQ